MNQKKGINQLSIEKKIHSLPGKNYFFGIGVNDYAYLPKLYNAKKDIEDIRTVLIEKYNFEEENTLVLSDTAATRRDILKQLNNYRKLLTNEDKLLVYYSGHGYFDGELGFWVPQEAEIDETAEYISNSEIREIIKVIQARHILLISDSCFSASLLVRDISKDLSGAFLEWEQKASRWVFCSGKGVVSDGQLGRNSPFTESILNQLKDSATQIINIVELADKVTKHVRFNYEQQAECCPLFQAGHDGGQFILYSNQFNAQDRKITKLKTLKRSNTLKSILNLNFIQFSYVPKNSISIDMNGVDIVSTVNGIKFEKSINNVYVEAFSISKNLVTFEQFDEFCHDTHREKPVFSGTNRLINPVINITWYDAALFCNWLSRKNYLDEVYHIEKVENTDFLSKMFPSVYQKVVVKYDLTKNGFRLPNEAEWILSVNAGYISPAGISEWCNNEYRTVGHEIKYKYEASDLSYFHERPIRNSIENEVSANADSKSEYISFRITRINN